MTEKLPDENEEIVNEEAKSAKGEDVAEGNAAPEKAEGPE